MACCQIDWCYEELVIACSCRLKGCEQPIVGSNGCRIIIHQLIDVQKKSVVTHSVLLGGLWPAGCWDCTGVDVIAAGFGLYSINVFVVCVECVKALLVNICYGTTKSAEIVSRDMWVYTGQHADCAGGDISPLDTGLDVWGEILVRDCYWLSQVSSDWTRWPYGVYRTTMLTMLRGQFSIYILIFLFWSGVLRSVKFMYSL